MHSLGATHAVAPVGGLSAQIPTNFSSRSKFVVKCPPPVSYLLRNSGETPVLNLRRDSHAPCFWSVVSYARNDAPAHCDLLHRSRVRLRARRLLNSLLFGYAEMPLYRSAPAFFIAHISLSRPGGAYVLMEARTRTLRAVHRDFDTQRDLCLRILYYDHAREGRVELNHATGT